MATFLFSTLSNGASVPFNSALDVLRFDNAGITAAGLIVSGPATGANPSFSFGGKTITLTGVSLLQLTTTNVTFANGSQLMVGDNTTGIVADDVTNTLTGSAAGDLIIGRGGNDTLIGLAGNDVLNGGEGTDTASFAGAASGVVASLLTNTASGGAGNDTLISIENLTGSGSADSLTGNGDNNVLNGGAEADTMAGAGGNDTYVVDNAGDVVTEAAVQGNDLIQSNISFSLAALPNVERITLIGTASINATGNILDNVLIGNAGANTILGGGGKDLLIGGADADRLLGGNHDDVLVFDAADLIQSGGAGTDTLQVNGAGVAVNLTAAAADIERVNLTGSGNNTLAIGAARIVALNALDSLRVTGDAGDAVQSADAWLYQGVFTDALGSFVRYTSGAATLEVDTDVDRSRIPFSVNLGALNGVNGVHLTGNDRPVSVSGAGDVNGDGFDDFLVGATDAIRPDGISTGAAYVVFGHRDNFPAELDLATAGAGVSRLFGEVANWGAGSSVSGAGDVNGNGVADLLVGADQASVNGGGSGAAYVVPGSRNGLPADLNLGSDGVFRLLGPEEGTRAGNSVSSAGDVNGDGFDDVVVGAMGSGHSSANVVFGRSGGFAPDLNLASLDGASGFRLLWSVPYSSGVGVSVSSGDVDGDGFDDILVGVSGAYGLDHGATCVVFGKSVGFGAIDLSTLNGVNGFRVRGGPGNADGRSVSSADVNGDGFDDLLVAAPRADPDASRADAGVAYVVFGKSASEGFVSVVDPATLDGRNGFRLSAEAAGDSLGGTFRFSGGSERGLAGAGDVNGDGFDDLIVGAYNADANGLNSGVAYVVFGRSGGFAANINLGNLTAADGFRISGAAAYDRAGAAVSSAGDVNGDGFDDLLVGADGAVPGGTNTRDGSYIVFGQDFTGTAVDFLGTAGNNTLTGTAAAETFVGGLDNDVLQLRGGADAARGGAGNDTIAIADNLFRRVDGGTGTDTLRLDGATLGLDLLQFPSGRIKGIEAIDLRATGANTLRLTAVDMLDLSDSSNTLLVRGGAGDTVDAADAGWVQGADRLIGILTYHSYTQGAATLLVQAEVTNQGGILA